MLVFLAAASSGGSLRECGRWLADAGSADLRRTARRRVRCPGRQPARRTERRTGNQRRHLPAARTAAKCSTTRTSWPGSRRRAAKALAFGPTGFAAGRDTLYLLTEFPVSSVPADRRADRHGDAGRAAPGRAEQQQARSAHGRHPGRGRQHLPDRRPARAVLPPGLPRHGAGHHLQSYQQGVSVWGEPGMAALSGASTKKVISAGIDDPRHARPWPPWSAGTTCRCVSVSYGDGRATSRSALRGQEILEAADIRARWRRARRCSSATGTRPALISLRPWYARPASPGSAAAVGPARPGPPCSAPPRTTTRRPGRRRCRSGTRGVPS